MRVRAREFDGKRLPRLYGIAWRIYVTDELVLFPVPLNVIARWAHAAYWAAFGYLKFDQSRRRDRDIYESGRREGEERILRQIDQRLVEAESRGYRSGQQDTYRRIGERLERFESAAPVIIKLER